MQKINLLDIYTDYLLCCPTQKTATGLAALLNNGVSHDKITRYLSSSALSSESLWLYVKPFYQQIESEEGVLIFDDSIQEKKYTEQNEIIRWHYDHTVGRNVKGVNFMTCFYHSQEINLPVGVEFIKKNKEVQDAKTGKTTFKSEKTKNELYREMLAHASQNVKFKYVLNDSWFSSAENMNFIVKNCHRHFIMDIKENRKVALTKEDKEKGKYVSIKSLRLEGVVLSVYVEQLDFPLLLTKQVFKNKDGSTGYRYLGSDDLNLTYEQITTIYKKRWKVEEYHQSVKGNAAFAKSPTQTVRTQTSHFIASILAYVKLEALKIRNQLNHFALKSRILLQANRAAYAEVQKLLTREVAIS